MLQVHTHKHTVIFFTLFLLFSFYDVVIDIFSTVIHFLLECGEYSLELIIEHIFHTSHHQSEIILINSLLALAFISLLGLWVIFPKICLYVKKSFQYYKIQKLKQWKALNWFEKLKISILYFIAVNIFIMLNM